jgi:2-hydroxy-3-keto-5-methylthiopentenyl-1-phosphate phosphatase
MRGTGRKAPAKGRKPTARPAGRPLAVLCDFDGTITLEDVAEALLRHFTGDGWSTFEKAYRAGRMSSRDALREQFALVRATKPELVAVAKRHSRVRSGFREFAELCRKNGVRLVVASEGLDFYIEPVLRKLDVEWHSNSARFAGRRLEVVYLDDGDGCDRCGNCKLKRLRALRAEGHRILYVGDGYSDVCPASEADLVLAREPLLGQLRRDSVKCEGFENFRDVQDYVEGFL